MTIGLREYKSKDKFLRLALMKCIIFIVWISGFLFIGFRQVFFCRCITFYSNSHVTTAFPFCFYEVWVFLCSLVFVPLFTSMLSATTKPLFQKVILQSTVHFITGKCVKISAGAMQCTPLTVPNRLTHST